MVSIGGKIVMPKYNEEEFGQLVRSDRYGNTPYAYSVVSCGLRELDVANLYDGWFEKYSPGDRWEWGDHRPAFFSHLYKFIESMQHRPGGVLLSDVVVSGGEEDSQNLASEFVAYLRKRKARVFDCGPAYRNPNSGNGIQVWIWLPKKTDLVVKEDVTHE